MTSGDPRRRATWRQAAAGLAVLAALFAVVATTTATALGGSDPGAGPSRTVGSGAVTAASDAGQSLFLQSCAACHGPQGGGGPNGPGITDAGAALTDFMLRTGRMPLAAPGAPVQRGTPAFSDDQIKALVAYVAGLGQGPAIPTVVTSGADLARGRDLFVSNCAACHGPSGGGGSVGGGFVAPALTQSDPTTVGEAVETGPDPMPKFSFAPDDLNALAAYVEYLRSAPSPGGIAPPQVGPVTEGFIAGLALIVLLVVARFIGVRVGFPAAAAEESSAPDPAERGKP